MKNLNDEEIIKLINKGFDIKLISLEFDIPIDYLQKLKNLEKQKEFVSDAIKNIEENLNKAVKTEKKQTKYDYLKEVLNKLNEISKYQLSVEEAYKICNLFSSEKVKGLCANRTFSKNMLNIVSNKLLEAISLKLLETEDIEELEQLKKLLPTQISAINMVSLDAMKRKIDNKILKLRQEEAIKNTFKIKSSEIKTIVEQIADGTLVVETAINIIEKEAEKQLENRPKNKFLKYTVEQEKSQILIQISNALTKNFEQYPIKNTTLAIQNLEKLLGDKEKSTRTVVMNLLGRKEFELAEEICNKIPPTSEHTESPFKIMLVNEIKKAKLKTQSMQSEEIIR